MPTDHILSLLIEERDKLNRAIEALQGSARRQGRPPKHTPAISSATTNGASRRSGMSATARKAQSERMKRYWAAKRRKVAANKS